MARPTPVSYTHLDVYKRQVKGVYVGVFDAPGGKQLLAWYVGQGLSPDVLRDRLAKRLQHYMIPGFLIPISTLPLNISGKIDRTRLPMPKPASGTSTALSLIHI